MRDEAMPSPTPEGDWEDGKPGAGKGGLKARAFEEIRKFITIALYVWILLSVFSMYRMLILRQHGIDVEQQGFAIVNALILGKVILIADDLKLGRWFRDSPLAYSVLWNSLLFAVALMAVHVIESAVSAWMKGHSVAAELAESNAGSIRDALALSLILFVTLIPFFASKEMARVLGRNALWQLFFTRGRKTFTLVVRD